jgi:glucokinase
MTVFVGVDLGGTQIRAVLADEAGTIRHRQSTRTQAHEGRDAVLRRICAVIRETLAGHTPAALGVGAPGPTDPYRGVVLMTPNMPGWRNVELSRHLAGEFGVPVFVGNDANLAGLAEHRYGAGVGCSHMIYITVSTGIGTGVIVDNRMLLGRQGLAAEVGHMTIDLQAEVDDPAAIGTLEGLASGPNIARRARTALRRGAASTVLELTHGDVDAVTPELLHQAAQAGDAFAVDQFRTTGRYLGVGITNMLHTFNPERIVIGGSVWLHCHELLTETLWETIRARAESPAYWQELSIVSAALGEDVGLLGAVALAVDGLHGKREA